MVAGSEVLKSVSKLSSDFRRLSEPTHHRSLLSLDQTGSILTSLSVEICTLRDNLLAIETSNIVDLHRSYLCQVLHEAHHGLGAD
jgi:hypothetical protein